MSCVCSSNATMLPQQFTTDATNTSLVLGPLWQSVTCSRGDTLGAPLVLRQVSGFLHDIHDYGQPRTPSMPCSAASQMCHACA